MSEINFNDQSNITFHYYSWAELGDITLNLAEKILDSSIKVDRIIALATGGLTMSRAMKDYTGTPKLSTMQISFYEDIAATKKTPIISQTIPINIEGETILLFDDINDTGNTLKYAIDYLTVRGAKKIYTATLFQKPHTIHPADYFEVETECWVIFPDEIRESIELLTANWSQQGLDKGKISNRLTKIGFKQDQVELFSNQ